MLLTGIPVSPGCVLGVSHTLSPLPSFDLELKFDGTPAQAQPRIAEAIRAMEAELARAKARYGSNRERVELIEVQEAMLEDPALQEDIQSNIHAGFAPETAVLRAALVQEEMLRSLNDEYMSARAEDVHDLGMRMACHIAGIGYPSLSRLEEDVIVVAADLLPTMLMDADLAHIRGLVIQTGTKTSHVSILASGMEIPTVVGCANAAAIPNGEPLYLDGAAGTVEYAMTGQRQQECGALASAYLQQRQILSQYAALPSPEDDLGRQVSLHVNIVNPVVLEKALQYRIDGVGLFRTEFLYMGRPTLPSEEEQFAVYRRAAQLLEGKPLTIRTLDIGGDKEAECLSLPKEANPFMGYRAVRLCLDREDVILPQLRAIVRASAYGNIQVMFPMIAVLGELRSMLALLEKAKQQLSQEGVVYAAHIKTGIMVEVPSAVVMLDQLAKHVDFVSIGSNDLTQYTYAADRMNQRVSYLYNSFDPAVLRLIQHTIAVAEQNGIECSLCGEMAGDPLGMAVLAALGLRKFSVSPSVLLRAKKCLSLMDFQQLKQSADILLEAEDANAVKNQILGVLPGEYLA